MDCSPPGSSVHGISQVRILEWVAISFSGDELDLGIKFVAPYIAGSYFTAESVGKPMEYSMEAS